MAGAEPEKNMLMIRMIGEQRVPSHRFPYTGLTETLYRLYTDP